MCHMHVGPLATYTCTQSRSVFCVPVCIRDRGFTGIALIPVQAHRFLLLSPFVYLPPCPTPFHTGTWTPRAWDCPAHGPCSPALAEAALSGPRLRGPVSTLVSTWLTPAGILGVGRSDLVKEWSGWALSECGRVTDTPGHHLSQGRAPLSQKG